MTNLGSTLSHVGEARNAVMRSVLLFLCAFAVITGHAQEQQQDTTQVKNTKKEKKLHSAMKEMLGINPTIRLVAPKSIARSEGKAVRVIDNRKKIGINT